MAAPPLSLQLEIPYDACALHLENHPGGLEALDQLWLEFRVHRNDPVLDPSTSSRDLDEMPAHVLAQRFSQDDLAWSDIEYQFLYLIKTYRKDGPSVGLIDQKYQCLLNFCDFFPVYNHAFYASAAIQLSQSFVRAVYCMRAAIREGSSARLAEWFRVERSPLNPWIGEETPEELGMEIRRRMKASFDKLKTELVSLCRKQ